MNKIDSIPLVTKLANVEDETTGDAFIVFKIKKTSSRIGRVTVPRDQADDSSGLLTMFIRKNADLPRDKAKAIRVIEEAIQSAPRMHRLRVRHVGWQKERKTFVIGRTIVGFSGGELKIAPPLWVDDHSVRLLGKRGSLEAWQRKVARPACYSSVLRLAILSSFAAPLVRVAGLPNFAINIFGPSKVGKTTALLACTSMYGIGSELKLPNWNSTAAAFMEEARGYSDLALPGNEVGLIDGKRRDAYAVIRSRIYTFAEGRDRSRMSKASITTPKYSATYRGIAVYTAEHSFQEYAAAAGEERSGGEYARALDVPAVCSGDATIFDSYPHGLSQAKRKAWSREKLISLRHGSECQYGTAIRPYIEHLMTVGKKLPTRVRLATREFMEHVQELGLDPVLDHAAKNFGVLYAGGCLGIEAGVLPWTKTMTLNAVLKCFKAAVGVTQNQEHPLDEAKRELQRRLASEKILPRTPAASFGPKEAAGFKERKGRSVQITVHSAAFRRWFANRAQCAAILRWLKDKELLLLGNEVRMPSSRGTEWAERAPRWPDGTTQKSFVFREPAFKRSKTKKRA